MSPKWEFMDMVDINGKEMYVDYDWHSKTFGMRLDGYDYTVSLQEVLEFWFKETYQLEETVDGQV